MRSTMMRTSGVLRSRLVAVVVALSFMLQACGYQAKLVHEPLAQPAGSHARYKLKSALVITPQQRAEELHLQIDIASITMRPYPEAYQIIQKRLYDVFSKVDIVDKGMMNEQEYDVLIYPTVTMDVRTPIMLNVQLRAEAFETASGRSIFNVQERQQEGYQLPGDAALYAFLTGFTLFLLSPITIPASVDSIGQYSQKTYVKLLEAAVDSAVTNLARDRDLREYAEWRASGGTQPQPRQQAPYATAGWQRPVPSQQPSPAPQQGTISLSREELSSIVQAAVEKASKDTKTPSARPAVAPDDISKPAFDASERLYGDNDVAVIIGIEGYKSIPKSDYSFEDATLVRDYLKALGMKDRNIEFITEDNATKSAFEKSLDIWLHNKVKKGGRAFVYYSGHGAPDPATGDAYLMPYDGDPNYLTVTGYPLRRLYEKMGKLKASEVVVVLDACFSGAGGRSVIAKGARPLVMSMETIPVPPNVIVMTATQGSQISTSSPDKGHGIFTYYFLRALKEGRKTVGDVYDYVRPLVEDEAKSLNVSQVPSMMPGDDSAAGRFLLRK